MTALLGAALGYVARGIPVYPVHWPRHIPDQASVCSCRRGPGCDRPAKHPLVHHGLHDATCDPGQLQDWWQRWPLANVGLVTGVVFDALDIDGPAGLAALGELQQATGLRFPGPLVATGGGGWHHWFAPTGLGNRPPRGLTHVDWRGRGGCVLAPPSRHISGRAYRWLVDLDQAPLAEVPAALRRRLDPDPPTPTRPTRTAGPDTDGHPYGRRVLADELAALARATPRPPQPHPQPHRVQGLPLRRRWRPRRPARHPCLHHRRARPRPGPGRDRPHPGLGPHRRPGQPPHCPGRTRPSQAVGP